MAIAFYEFPVILVHCYTGNMVEILFDGVMDFATITFVHVRNIYL